MSEYPLISQLEEAFQKHSDEKVRIGKTAYMMDNFPFLGLTNPVRTSIEKPLFKLHPIKEEKELIRVLERLYAKEEREFHYAALNLSECSHRLWTPNMLFIFEKMIRMHSWWDSVDTIASKLVGALLKKYPELIPVMDQWIEDDNLWIRRTAILFSLKWKEKTDTKRLFAYCAKTMHEKEFFIRKAIGWALREYSKTDPDAVSSFIVKNQSSLSGLSVREGSKYI